MFTLANLDSRLGGRHNTGLYTHRYNSCHLRNGLSLGSLPFHGDILFMHAFYEEEPRCSC